MEIGNKILELRKYHKLSQEQLADKMNVARQTISKWELGETSPDLKQAKQLSKIFNVSLDELTNNNIKDLLILKVSNTERLAAIIIKILKGIGILIIVAILITTFIVVSKKYFTVTLNNMVADSYGVYCEVNGKKHYFEATVTRDELDAIDLHSTDEEILKKMNIDTSKYKSIEKVIKQVKKYIITNGGTCN